MFMAVTGIPDVAVLYLGVLTKLLGVIGCRIVTEATKDELLLLNAEVCCLPRDGLLARAL